MHSIRPTNKDEITNELQQRIAGNPIPFFNGDKWWIATHCRSGPVGFATIVEGEVQIGLTPEGQGKALEKRLRDVAEKHLA